MKARLPEDFENPNATTLVQVTTAENNWYSDGLLDQSLKHMQKYSDSRPGLRNLLKNFREIQEKLISAHGEYNEMADAVITNLQNKINEQAAELTSKNTKISEQSAAILTLQDSQAVLTAQVAKLKTEVSTIRNENKELSFTLSTLQTTHQNLQTEHTKVLGKNTDLSD